MKSLSEIFKRINSSPNAEAQQALIVRPLAGGIVTLYTIIVYPTGAWQITATALVWLIMLLGGAAIVIWIYKHPVVVPARYLTAIILDASVLTAGIYINNEYGLALYPLYMWIAFGHGLRFGARYLIICALFSGAGFTLLWLIMPIWNDVYHTYLFAWFALGLLLVPSYGAILLKKLEEALEAANAGNRMKSNLINNMSHELRTPLNPLLGYTQMLLWDESLSNANKEMIANIEKQGRHLLALINNLLEASRVGNSCTYEADKVIIASFDLRCLIEETISLFSGSTKDVKIDYYVDDSVPDMVISNKQIVGLSLFNLVSNAIKFTSYGTVTIKAYSVDDTLFIDVVDTGCGIPSKQQDEIFDFFTQIDNSITRRYGGMGLGLTIVRDVISALGGEVRVESLENSGSTFTLLIPIAGSCLHAQKI